MMTRRVARAVRSGARARQAPSAAALSRRLGGAPSVGGARGGGGAALLALRHAPSPHASATCVVRAAAASRSARGRRGKACVTVLAHYAPVWRRPAARAYHRVTPAPRGVRAVRVALGRISRHEAQVGAGRAERGGSTYLSEAARPPGSVSARATAPEAPADILPARPQHRNAQSERARRFPPGAGEARRRGGALARVALAADSFEWSGWPTRSHCASSGSAALHEGTAWNARALESPRGLGSARSYVVCDCSSAYGLRHIHLMSAWRTGADLARAANVQSLGSLTGSLVAVQRRSRMLTYSFIASMTSLVDCENSTMTAASPSTFGM